MPLDLLYDYEAKPKSRRVGLSPEPLSLVSLSSRVFASAGPYGIEILRITEEITGEKDAWHLSDLESSDTSCMDAMSSDKLIGCSYERNVFGRTHEKREAIKLYDINENKIIQTIPCEESFSDRPSHRIYSLKKLSTDTFASGDKRRQLSIWDIRTNKISNSWDTHKGTDRYSSSLFLEYSPVDEKLISLSEGMVQVWDWRKTSRCTHNFKACDLSSNYDNRGHPLAVLPNRKLVFVVPDDRIGIFNIQNNKFERNISCDSDLTTISVLNDLIMVGRRDNFRESLNIQFIHPEEETSINTIPVELPDRYQSSLIYDLLSLPEEGVVIAAIGERYNKSRCQLRFFCFPPRQIKEHPIPKSQNSYAPALEQLLKFVAHGEQDKAEAMLQEDKRLLLYAGTVKDLSKREFKEITAFQYALWALDWHMWKMIQKYLSPEAQLEQFQLLEKTGTNYGKYFSLEILIDALKNYVNYYDQWTYNTLVEHWRKKIGGMQKMLPTHIVNEYCRSDRSFYPCPTFTDDKWPGRTFQHSQGPLTSHESKEKSSEPCKENWFIKLENAGEECSIAAFYRGKEKIPSMVRSHMVSSYDSSNHKYVSLIRPSAIYDLQALQSLWKVRQKQLAELKSELLSPSNTVRTTREDDSVTPVYIQKWEREAKTGTDRRSVLPISQIIPQTLMPTPRSSVSKQLLNVKNELTETLKK